MGWEVERRLKREEMYVYFWLIHADIWQKPTQHHKAIVPQLKIKNKTKKENLHHILTFLSLPFIYQVFVGYILHARCCGEEDSLCPTPLKLADWWERQTSYLRNSQRMQ